MIRAGQTTGTITATVVEDIPYEGPEAYTVALGSPTNALLGATTSVTTTITDDGTGSMPNGGTPTDDRPVVQSISSPSVSEGSNLDFVVQVNHVSTIPTTYTVAAQSDTGTVGADTSTALQASFDGGLTWVAIAGGTVTVPANVSSFIVRVPTTEDSTVEANETVRLVVGGSTGTGTILNDDVALNLDESALALGNLENAAQATSAAPNMGNGAAGASYSFASDTAALLNAQNFKSDGMAIVWSVTGTTLVGTAGNGDGASNVVTVTLNGSTGEAAVKLNGPFDHAAGNASNALALAPLSIVNSANAAGDTRSLNISIIDDVPVAETQSRTVAQQDTNLLIILDTSGSMSLTDGRSGGQSRLDIAKASITELIRQYEAVGDVRVTLTTFSTESSGYVVLSGTPAQAIAALNGPAVQASGYTNYDQAISNAESQWAAATAGNLPNGVNVSYFVSDGKPEGNSDAQTNTFKLDGTELTTWTQFLTTNNMQSIAVGTGTQVQLASSATDFRIALESVAYDGRNSVDANTSNVIVSADPTDLTEALLSTVPQGVSGTLLGGSVNTASSAGADGGIVSSVTVGSTTYTYDGVQVSIGGTPLGATDTPNADGSARYANGELSITTAAGLVQIDLDEGGYSFNSSSTAAINLTYQLTDGDGDTSVPAILTLQASTLTMPAGSQGTPNADANLNGDGASNFIDGRAGNDAINGGAGNDYLYGGAGSDVLIGGAGSDVFAWRLSDASTTLANATDRITDFDKSAVGVGGDILDLRDLLQGEHAGNDLSGFLKFETTAGTTTLHINSAGTFNAGGAENQSVVFTGTDFSTFGSDSASIIQNLLNQNKLIVDN